MRRCWCGGDVAGNPDGPPACSESDLHDPLSDGRPKEIKRLYVAGPMSGYPQANYPAFREAASVLRHAGYEVVNPVDVHAPERHHYVDLIREDLRMMLDCHAVAVLEYWWESPGARNEVQVAGMLKMPVRPVMEWLNRLGVVL